MRRHNCLSDKPVLWIKSWLAARGVACIADPPILSSSPENGSATAMQGRFWLAKTTTSSASRARSLHNVPLRLANAQSLHSFFWDYLRISQKIPTSNGCGLLDHTGRNRTEENLKKNENLDSALTWRSESQWIVPKSHSAAVCGRFRPMAGLFYKAVPVLGRWGQNWGIRNSVKRIADWLRYDPCRSST